MKNPAGSRKSEPSTPATPWESIDPNEPAGVAVLSTPTDEAEVVVYGKGEPGDDKKSSLGEENNFVAKADPIRNEQEKLHAFDKDGEFDFAGEEQASLSILAEKPVGAAPRAIAPLAQNTVRPAETEADFVMPDEVIAALDSGSEEPQPDSLSHIQHKSTSVLSGLYLEKNAIASPIVAAGAPNIVPPEDEMVRSADPTRSEVDEGERAIDVPAASPILRAARIRNKTVRGADPTSSSATKIPSPRQTMADRKPAAKIAAHEFVVPPETIEALGAGSVKPSSEEPEDDSSVLVAATAKIDTITRESIALPKASDELWEDLEMEEDAVPISTGGGWTIPLLCAGVALIACCIVIPQTDANRRLAYEKQILQIDLESIQKQISVNDEFLKRVMDDPSLSERLAQRQLKRVRKGQHVLQLDDEKVEMSPFQIVTIAPPPPLAPYKPVGGIIASLCYNPRTRLYVMGAAMTMVASGLVMGSSKSC